MSDNKKTKPSLIVVNIEEHINSAYKRQNNATGVILPTGEHHYFIHGHVATVEEFNEVFPLVPLKENVNKYGGSLDGRQIEKH